MNRAFSVLTLTASLLSACATTAPQTRGAALYEKHCTSCHGTAAQGDGPLAQGLAVKPANLTLLARKNGGIFPAEDVIAQIYGYTGRHQFGGMPEFGRDIGGPSVDWVSASGEVVATPRALLDLADYLETIQQ